MAPLPLIHLLRQRRTNRRPPMIAGHDKPGPGRRTGHKNCANCLDYALVWLADLHDRVEALQGSSAEARA